MSSLDLPFAHLNLRWNPFGEVPEAGRGELAVVEVDRFATALQCEGTAVQFLGECGSGKTTHLLVLRDRLPQAAYVRMIEGQRLVVPEAAILLVDDYDVVPQALRRRILRRARSLAIATHEDHSSEIEAAGLVVESVSLAGMTADRLAAIIARRIAWARRGPGAVPRVTSRAVQALLSRFGDDVRAVEDHLYDLFQDMGGIADVEV